MSKINKMSKAINFYPVGIISGLLTISMLTGCVRSNQTANANNIDSSNQAENTAYNRSNITENNTQEEKSKLDKKSLQEKARERIQANFKGKLSFFYENSKNTTAQKILEELKKNNVYKNYAATISKRIALPRDIKIVARDCGTPNAFYSFQDASITMCNEFPVYLNSLFLKAGYPQKQATTITDYILGFTFYHEVGHMVINELKLPITGKEEDSADEFALFILTKTPENKQKASLIIDSAIGWYNIQSGLNNKITKVQLSNENSLDEQRSHSLFCSLYVEDSNTYGSVASYYGFTDKKLEECRKDTQRTNKAFTRFLSPYFKTRSTAAKNE